MSAAEATPLKREKRGVTTSTMKIVAVVTMFIDHFAVIFGDKLYPALPFLNADGFEILRIVGRIAFPLFAFMIALGATYTKNIYKYLFRLLAFAFLSEIPFDLFVFRLTPGELLGSKEAFTYQNVFFTLFLGLLGICVYQKLRERKLEAVGFIFVLFAAYAAEDLLKTDYGAMGVLCIFMFFVFLQAPRPAFYVGTVLTLLALAFMLTFHPYIQRAITVTGRQVSLYHMDVYARLNITELFAALSLPLLLRHNGQKGKRYNRWFFYIFYPAHLLLLWGAYMLLFG
jgi:hypothetical protein